MQSESGESNTRRVGSAGVDFLKFPERKAGSWKIVEKVNSIQFQTDFLVAPRRFTLQKHSSHRHCFYSDSDQSKLWLIAFLLRIGTAPPCRARFARHKQSYFRIKFLLRIFELFPKKTHTKRPLISRIGLCYRL